MKLVYILFLLFNCTLLISQAGMLDSSFGNSGKVITGFENSTARATALSVQSDGKILLAGSDFSGSGGEEVVVVRYLPSGQIDSVYGIEGSFTYDNSNYAVHNCVIDIEDNLYILVSVFEVDQKNKAIVMKLTVDGILDTSFAVNGIWKSELTDVDEYCTEIAMQENGQILISGTHSTFPVFPDPFTNTVRRINSDGTIDTSFGIDGSASIPVTGGFNTRFLTLNSIGEIFTGGFSVNLMDLDSSKALLIKYNNDGLVDSSFGVDGIFESEGDINERATCLSIQSNDMIIMGTRNYTNSGTDFGLIRIDKDGFLDENFGNDGRVTMDFSENDNATSILLHNDGKIILAGTIKTSLNYDYAISRYDSNGNLDFTFGENGVAITDFGLNDFLNTTALQTDGKLICAGSSGDELTPVSFSMARYLTEELSKTEDINQQINNITLYPNPTRSSINLEFELNRSTQVSISLLNSQGKLVQEFIDHHRFEFGRQNLKLNLGKDINAGLYTLKIETLIGSMTRTIAVQ